MIGIVGEGVGLVSSSRSIVRSGGACCLIVNDRQRFARFRSHDLCIRCARVLASCGTCMTHFYLNISLWSSSYPHICCCARVLSRTDLVAQITSQRDHNSRQPRVPTTTTHCQRANHANPHSEARDNSAHNNVNIFVWHSPIARDRRSRRVRCHYRNLRTVW